MAADGHIDVNNSEGEVEEPSASEGKGVEEREEKGVMAPRHMDEME